MHLNECYKHSTLTAICCSAILFGLLAFNIHEVSELARQTLIKLNAVHHLGVSESKMKRYELLISDDGFFRYRKHLLNGQQKYYSFNVLRFQDLDYVGNTSMGTLILRTQGEDVIVQTYNDPQGNIDSMASQVNFPVKSIEAEDLHLIRENLLQIKGELQLK